MASRGGRGRGTRSRRAAQPAEQPQAEPAAQDASPGDDGEASKKAPSHAAHHRMIARNLNDLIENFGEFRNENINEIRELKREFKRLDAKLFRLQNSLEQLSSSHDKFMEEMTTVAFDTNLDLRGGLNHVEALWKALVELAGEQGESVEKHKQRVEESEKRRVAEIDRKLSDLAAEAERNKKVHSK